MRLNTKLSALRPVTLLAFAFVFASIGCQNGSQDSEPSGTIQIRYETPVTNLNPYVSLPVGSNRYVAHQMFLTLGKLNAETLEMEPLLVKELPTAEKLNDSDSSQYFAYTFEFLEEASWDDGSPITAKDYEFSLKLIYHPLLPSAVWRGYFDNLVGFEADPDNPKRFTIVTDGYYYLGLASMCQVPVYPRYHYDPDGALEGVSLDDLRNPESIEQIKENAAQKAFATEFQDPKYATDPEFIVGCGPYKLKSLDGDRGLTLERKENWWGDKVKDSPLHRAYPKELVYRVVREDDMVVNMLKTGELDIALNLNGNKFNELKEDPQMQEAFNFKTQWAPTISRCLFNMRVPQLREKEVRQALAKLADYEYFINSASAGLAQRVGGIVPTDMPYYADDIELHQLDPDKASTILEEAGWTDTNGDGVRDKMVDGKRIELELDMLYTSTSITTEMVANSLVSTFKQGGVKVNLVPTDLRNITLSTRKGEFETALVAAALYAGDAELNQYYHSSNLAPNGDNRSGLTNSELDRIIDEIHHTQDKNKRAELFKDAQKIIYDETPEIFIYNSLQRYVISKKLDPVITSARPGYYEQLFKVKQ